jgi:hypothetical protein
VKPKGLVAINNKIEFGIALLEWAGVECDMVVENRAVLLERQHGLFCSTGGFAIGRTKEYGALPRRSVHGRRFQVHFDQPTTGVAPGQAAVCYQDDRVLGGGWIE